MFHDYLEVQQYGIWGERTVWRHLSAMSWSVWEDFIHGIIPMDFYTDFASVPRHFHMYDRFGGKCNAEADVHDFLYRKNATIHIDIDKWPNIEFPDKAEEWLKTILKTGWHSNFPKELSDYIFRQLMIEDDESISIYDPMYLAVSLAGYSSFHRFEVNEKLPCDKLYKIKYRR